MTKVFATTIAMALFLVSFAARAEPVDCRKDADAFASSPQASAYAWLRFFTSPAIGDLLSVSKPCTGSTCKVAYLSTSKWATMPIPPGYSLNPNYGTPNKAKWAGAPRASNSKCAALHLIVFDPGVVPTGTPAPPAAPQAAATTVSSALFEPPDRSTALRMHLEDYKQVRQAGMSQLGVGTSQGLSDAVAETLQILGQIVVDRASAEAYRLLKQKLEHLLGCDKVVSLTGNAVGVPVVPPAPSATPTAGAPTTADVSAKSWPTPTFPATCKLVGPLRLQDIATSTDALRGALAQDGLAYLKNLEGRLSRNERAAEEIGVAGVLASIVVPLVARPQLLAENGRALAIAGAIEAYVDSFVEKKGDGFDNEAQHAIVAGVVAYTRCVYEVAKTPGTSLAGCPVGSYATLYASPNVNTETAARALAAQLVAVATLNTTGAPDPKQRAIHAVDALFSSSCMLLSPVPGSASAQGPTSAAAPANEVYPQFKCPDPPDRIDPGKLTVLDGLALAQPIVDAALEGDSNALVSSLARVVALFASAQYEQTHKRAFLLIGSLVEYGATFAETGTNSAQLHDQRTKILESLTKDMTDRTARDGDEVWSFGGSLRAVGGARFGGAGPALLGPLSLPIGIGFDHVAGDSSAGIHLEFGAIDLGQYIAYDNTGTVKTPVVADAIEPSFSIAAGWGKSIPLIIGAMAGYSPAFALSASKDTRGAFNCGAFIGMYVPLIDMN